MPITAANIEYRLSGGAANADPNASLGGAKSSTTVPAGFFDDVTSDEGAAGDTEYRCWYVHNAHGSLTLQNAKVWLVSNTTGNRIALGVGTAAVNAQEQSVANEQTAPSGVSFSAPADKANGLALGNIGPGQHKAVWERRVIGAGAAAANDSYSVRVEGDTAA